MFLTCLDLEGVLVPEIWIRFSEATGIKELERTTRDEPDYDKLMNFRIGILKSHNLGIKEIQQTIAGIDPLPGAKDFLDELRSFTQVIILSDTFEQFAALQARQAGNGKSLAINRLSDDCLRGFFQRSCDDRGFLSGIFIQNDRKHKRDSS